MWISIQTEPTPTFGLEPSPDRVGWGVMNRKKMINLQFGKEGREEGRDGREAETGGLSQAAQRRRLHITGARAASYQRSLLAATIRQCRATMCPFITSTATTVGETLVPPPTPTPPFTMWNSTSNPFPPLHNFMTEHPMKEKMQLSLTCSSCWYCFQPLPLCDSSRLLSILSVFPCLQCLCSRFPSRWEDIFLKQSAKAVERVSQQYNEKHSFLFLIKNSQNYALFNTVLSILASIF